MIQSQLDLLEIQDQEAVKNTYYRYPKVIPHVNRGLNDEYLEIKTIDNFTRIYKIDEVTLYIIARIRWTPAWLIHQWYELYDLDGYSAIEQWINVGLVWAQTSATGVMIRPTYFLFNLMDIKDSGYVDIPFNLLNHTCAEMQILFDAMMGNEQSELWKQIKNNPYCLKPYHPLNIKVNEDSGVPVFVEEEYRVSMNNDNIKQKQDDLIRSIKTNNPYTQEFIDNTLFVLLTEDILGKNKSEVYKQIPDLVIPAIRYDRKPNSIAIELELSAKTDIKYDKIMQSYKNNLIYGTVIYLCGNNAIVEKVKKAYQEAGGLGRCRLFVAPWRAPAQRITDYSSREETAYKQLLSATHDNTQVGENRN